MGTIYELNNELMNEVEDSADMKPFPEDEEVRVEIVDFLADKEGSTIRYTKEGEYPYVMPIMEVRETADDAAYNNFTHYLGLPSTELEAKRRKRTANDFRKFHTAFSIPLTQEFNTQELIGQQALAILGIDDDATYGKRNRVKEFIVGK